LEKLEEVPELSVYIPAYGDGCLDWLNIGLFKEKSLDSSAKDFD
jgi:hypothetical protein